MHLSLHEWVYCRNNKTFFVLLILHRNSSAGNPIYKVLYKLLSIHLVKSNLLFNSLGRAIRDLFFPHSTFMSCPFWQTWFSSSKFCVSQESEHESLSPWVFPFDTLWVRTLQLCWGVFIFPLLLLIGWYVCSSESFPTENPQRRDSLCIWLQISQLPDSLNRRVIGWGFYLFLWLMPISRRVY